MHSSGAVSYKTPITILYRDEYFIAFDKPAKMLVIPTHKDEDRTLTNIVNQQYASLFPEGALHPCHRLDRDTSGVILFANGKRHQQAMMELFHQKLVKKKYIAFVRGKLENRAGELRSRVRDVHQRGSRHQQPAQLAVTKYEVAQVRKNYSILNVWPVTGRTNQIRIQFSEIGNPLLGERQYAFGKDFEVKFRRVALHANELEWVHPYTREKIKVVAQLPQDLLELQTQY